MPTLLMPDSRIAGPIKMIISDVDGVMTDGRIVYDDALVETKRFHVRDGLGIRLWLRSGFEFAILTGRTSKLVAHRAAELGIGRVVQGRRDKWQAATELIGDAGRRPEDVCYIGDDLPDVAVMKRVGLAVVPADASGDARHVAHWVLRRRGGDGAVRELTERLLRAKNRWEEHVPG